ncbi:class I SAM-dependent methyltransferase [Sphaerisporangium sp. NPDC088356]|uniref:class I SAM-dependent methyltransferase n=1 Tax=Sphaerisporangium sp. NPDC088356 TaxID=3154871 RepID=UPI0034382791
MIGNETPIWRLLRSAGGADDDIRAAIEEIGEAPAAALMADEVASRCEPPPGGSSGIQPYPSGGSSGIRPDPPGGSFDIQLELAGAGRSHPYVLSVSASGVTASAATAEDPAALIVYDLVALARALYGTGVHGEARVEVNWPPAERLGEAIASIHALARAVESVLTACRSAETNLDRLATRFGSDKYGTMHWYTPHYARYFSPLRDELVRVLEIGVGGYHDPASGGASLRMWQRYFRRGLVFGLDLFPKTGVQGPRIRTLAGDQGDPAALRALAEEHGPFDIVIDDGSHMNAHVLVALRELFPHVRPGGLYVVEDVQTSYWPMFGGGRDVPGTTAEFAKTVIDGLNHREFADPGHVPSYFDGHVVAAHFHHNLMVLEKGDNHEQAAPSWIPRR